MADSANAPTARVSDCTPYAQGAYHAPDRIPAPPVTMAGAMLALTLIELGLLDAPELGTPVSALLATPGITQVIFAAKRDHEIGADRGARKTARARIARKLYRCSL